MLIEIEVKHENVRVTKQSVKYDKWGLERLAQALE